MPQFLGMYRLTVDGVETYMVVTRNVFSHRLTVHRKYDLKVKGSASPSVEAAARGSHTPGKPPELRFRRRQELWSQCA